MGLPYPGGISIDRITPQGNPNAYPLPTPHVSGSEMDFSFSGLKTAVINLLHHASQKGESVSVPDLAASLAYKVADILSEKTFLAAQHLGYRSLVVAGGVSANSTLRRKLEEGCREKGISLYLPPLALCGDNAAMIGAQAYYQYLAGKTADLSLNGSACMDIEEEF